MHLQSSISTRLEYQHKSLLDLIEGLNDDQVRQQIVSGKWSIFENIVHLAIYQHVFLNRIEEIVKNDNPTFEKYSSDTDPYFHDNCTKSTHEIIHQLITTRRLMVARIFSLQADQLKRTGRHPTFGNMTIVQWIQFFVLHEAHHLFTIFKLAAGFR
jgi:uncharacterized damage-inducible protein DinB